MLSEAKGLPCESVDVTYNELIELQKVKALKPILDSLKQYWVGEMEHRAEDTRIGSIDVFQDNEGHIHLDFVTRFFLKPLKSPDSADEPTSGIQGGPLCEWV